MKINVGCELTVICPQPTPLLLLLQPHSSRQQICWEPIQSWWSGGAVEEVLR